MGKNIVRSKIQTRPNSVCLVCDGGGLKEPNRARSFYTCSELCYRAIQRGISSLSMKDINESSGKRRRYSNNGYQLSCAYFVLRESNQSLSGLEVIDRVRNNFGKKRSFKTNSFTHLFPFFENNVERKKINGSFHYSIVDKTIPFNQVLKSKYAEYLFEQRV